ncbi:MAG: serine kinase [Firmicutes bacterium]|nr:serine kinase [Bacillota bacterium]
MKVRELADKLELEVISGPFEKEINGVYIGDLLSNVMAKAAAGNLWITVHGHVNVVAVASLTQVAAVIVVEDFPIESAAVQKAQTNQVTILRTPLTAVDLLRKLIELGV